MFSNDLKYCGNFLNLKMKKKSGLTICSLGVMCLKRVCHPGIKLSRMVMKLYLVSFSFSFIKSSRSM